MLLLLSFLTLGLQLCERCNESSGTLNLRNPCARSPCCLGQKATAAAPRLARMAGCPGEGGEILADPGFAQATFVGAPSGTAFACHLAQLAAQLPPADIIPLPDASGGGYLVVRRRDAQQSSLAQRRGAAPPLPLCPSAAAGLPAPHMQSQQPATLPPRWSPRHERRYQRQLTALHRLAASLLQRRASAGAGVPTTGAGSGDSRPTTQPLGAARQLALGGAATQERPEGLDSAGLAPGACQRSSGGSPQGCMGHLCAPSWQVARSGLASGPPQSALRLPLPALQPAQGPGTRPAAGAWPLQPLSARLLAKRPERCHAAAPGGAPKSGVGFDDHSNFCALLHVP